jgi:hypothetical protein
MTLRPGAPVRGFPPPVQRGVSRCAVALVCLLATWSATADAQPRSEPRSEPRSPRRDPSRDAKESVPPSAKEDDKPDKPGKSDKPGKPKVFDFTGIDLAGRLHTPQLLYFLERANEELERAFLERRSFIPHMVRSLEEEAL